jgi:RimJ/RimL family protein N-acetyltransferase
VSRRVTATLPGAGPLVGRHVRLDPLTEADAQALHPVLADPAVYASGYVMHRRPADVEDTRSLLRERFLRAPLDGRGGGKSPYAVRLVADGELGAAGTVVGTTSLLEADLVNESAHVGSTLYGSHWWGTPVNPECKLLLLGHAFDELEVQRVLFKTDALNARSRAAISQLGAAYDGTLRHHRLRSDGSVRDSAYFSVLAAEWPAVRDGLRARVDSVG